jgi:hypothetical protein
MSRQLVDAVRVQLEGHLEVVEALLPQWQAAALSLTLEDPAMLVLSKPRDRGVSVRAVGEGF